MNAEQAIKLNSVCAKGIKAKMGSNRIQFRNNM